jgi:hypothetical protein
MARAEGYLPNPESSQMRNIARRLNRLEQKSGTKEKRFIWVDSPEELERRRAELEPDDIVIRWRWSDDQEPAV